MFCTKPFLYMCLCNLQPLMLVDKELVPHVFPVTGEEVVLEHKDTVFVHLAQPGSSTLTGYTLRFSKPGVSASL